MKFENENSIVEAACTETRTAFNSAKFGNCASDTAPMLCSRRDACTRWGIGSTSLDILVRTGKIASFKFGAKRMIIVASGDAYFSALASAN